MCLLIHVSVASYAVPVRQYQSLPVGFLHCCRYQQPACHLLTVRGVTPARKGLSPSGIISCYTFTFNNKNLYFKHFFRAYSKVCTCSCWAHTFCIFHRGFSSMQAVVFRTFLVRTMTENHTQIPYLTCNFPLTTKTTITKIQTPILAYRNCSINLFRSRKSLISKLSGAF